MVKLILILMLIPVAYADRLTVVTEYLPIYQYVEKGEVVGPSTQIVKRVLEHAEVEYSIRVLPWRSAYNLALEHENILIYTIVRIAPRENLFKWIRPLGRGGTADLYRLRKNEHVNPTTIDEAKKYIILVDRDTMSHHWLVYHGFENIRVHENIRYANITKMLFGERGPLVAIDSLTWEHELKEYGLNRANTVRVMTLFETPIYMALSLKTSDDLLQKLQDSYDLLLSKQLIKLVN